MEKAKLNRKRGWIPLVHPPRSSVCESSKPCQVLYRALNRSSQCSRRTNLSSSYCQPGLGEGGHWRPPPHHFELKFPKVSVLSTCRVSVLAFHTSICCRQWPLGAHTHTHNSWDHTSLQQMFFPTQTNFCLPPWSSYQVSPGAAAAPYCNSPKFEAHEICSHSTATRIKVLETVAYNISTASTTLSLTHTHAHTHSQMRLQR